MYIIPWWARKRLDLGGDLANILDSGVNNNQSRTDGITSNISKSGSENSKTGIVLEWIRSLVSGVSAEPVLAWNVVATDNVQWDYLQKVEATDEGSRMAPFAFFTSSVTLCITISYSVC